MSTEKADCGVILSQAERIHDSGGGETVGGGPLHGLGRGGSGRVLNHCRAGGVSRVVIRVRDVEPAALAGSARPLRDFPWVVWARLSGAPVRTIAGSAA